MKYLTTSRGQQLYLGLVLLVVFPVVTALVFQHDINDFFLDQFARPRLEREFGFTAGTIQVPTATGACSQFAVVAVSANGILARAGIRPGDLPVGYKHGFATGFYQDLLAVRRGQPVEIQVLSASDYGKGWEARRKVRIEPPVAR